MALLNRCIRVSEPNYGPQETIAVLSCLADGQLTMASGPAVDVFERTLCSAVDVEHAVACSSGTSALHLALLALGIGPGDVVAVPPLTYVATVAAVRYVGAEPLFIDVDDGWTIDPAALRTCGRAINAIIPVHLYGNPVDDDVFEFANEFGIPVIEDCAQSLGADISLRGVAGIFSFYANKAITTMGEGGALITQQPEIARRARLFRGQGQDPGHRYHHIVVGHNYRMTAAQAAFGTAQIKSHLMESLRLRRQVADVYRAELPDFATARMRQSAVDWLHTVLVPHGVNRDDVMQVMAADFDVETRPAFPSVARMSPYARWDCHGLDKTDDVASRGISLPTHPKLTAAQLERVVRAFRTAVVEQTEKVTR